MIDKKNTYTQFKAWLEGVCASEKPDSDIVAYNFGLFEGENGYVTHLIGSKEYVEEDPDWACNQDFVPKCKYFELPGSDSANWQEIQTMVEAFVKQFISAPDRPSCFLSTAQAITVGFDDGDLVKVN